MGKAKQYIDKKRAVTYSLIYRSTEDADAPPERVLVEAERGVGIGRPDAEAAAQQHAAHAASGRRYPPGHPLTWLESGPESGSELSDERRRELLELGFPDDGYDYLQHMRTLGHGSAALEGPGLSERQEDGAAGPSVFVPAAEVSAPEEDVRLFDATRLTLMQQAEREEEAAGLMGGVTAFSRQKQGVRGAERRELEEVDELLRLMEEADEGEGEACGPEGVGDLLDDFVLAATEAADPLSEGPGSAPASELSGSCSASEDETLSDSCSEGEAAEGSAQAPARPGSIASTYWRDERRDRKELLAVIDERFEHLALEYDDEEIGDMEEQEGEIQGPAVLEEFAGVLDEFHATHSHSLRAYENNVPYESPAFQSAISSELGKHGFSDEDGAVAVAKAREALRRAEEAERSGGEEQEVMWVGEAGKGAHERWDCESVLSLRSNLDNHPGRIQDGASGRRANSQDVVGGSIKLGRHGIPVGVQPSKPTAAALRQLDRTAHGAMEPGAEAAAVDALPPASAMKRDKGETAEEKRARKAAVKEAKREARANKKALKEVFRDESAKAQRRAASALAQGQGAVKLN